MGQTANYGLKQWESWENLTRTGVNGALEGVDGALSTMSDVFNEVLTGITATLGEKCALVTGAFTGTAAEDTMTEQTVSLGFAPKTVIYGAADFKYSGQDGYNANAMVIYPGVTCIASNGWDSGSAELTQTGFKVAGMSNYQGIAYHYLAFR